MPDLVTFQASQHHHIANLDQLRRQSFQCRWTSSLKLSAVGHQTAVLDSRWCGHSI